MLQIQCKHIIDGTNKTQCPEMISYSTGNDVPVLMAPVSLGTVSLIEEEIPADNHKEQKTIILTLKCLQNHIHNYEIPVK